MAWPFTNVVAPNVDSDFITLTGSLVDVPSLVTGPAWLLGLYVQNSTSALVTFRLTDANGKNVMVPTDIPAGATLPIHWNFLPVSAKCQWTGNGLLAKLWGYQ